MNAPSQRVEAMINYTARMRETPRYHAMDHSRDVHLFDPRRVAIRDDRAITDRPSLVREGFELVAHRSAVRNFLDQAELERVYFKEICDLICEVTGARAASVVATPFVRFGERSELSGKLKNSVPARFVHIDYSDARGKATAEQVFAGLEQDWTFWRFVHYNIWRVLTPPPQDIPLAVCDARSLQAGDIVPALAVFDFPGVPERTAESYVLRYNPAHHWHYFRDMTPDEALIFVTNESDRKRPHHVAHTAFDDPTCPATAEPRSSIEIRVVAYYV
ncbi:MAG TPA: CmcJ/NvfI family oxidoreductase [Steroidobacteraceae bacterium]|nr:CmcJ/NvfI family oxidoreductase [Steroidobacteraceae bacterium]